MPRILIGAVLVVALSGGLSVHACNPYRPQRADLTLLATLLGAEDSSPTERAAAERAVTELRRHRYAGFAHALAYRDLLTQGMESALTSTEFLRLKGERDRVDAGLDQIAAQRYAAYSRLYWYTDLEEAKTMAQKSNKPILSLRMLGKLTDEYSCANSRFFRTILYANTEVSTYLRENFVLHWESVRPVPKVTIDFGDGRKLERTLTGNSIHWVLDCHGRPVDGLPGLYGPEAFLKGLVNARGIAMISSEMPGENPERERALAAYHLLGKQALDSRCERELREVAPELAAKVLMITLPEGPDRLPRGGELAAVPARAQAAAVPMGVPAGAAPAPIAVPAGAAMLRASTKSRIETPVLRMVDVRALEKEADREAWQRLASKWSADCRLDAASRTLILRQVGKTETSPSAKGMLVALEESISLDTVRNEYLMHRQIHEWLQAGLPETREVGKLTEKTYAELFLTPSSDPWLGLRGDDVYTALERDGVLTSQTTLKANAAP